MQTTSDRREILKRKHQIVIKQLDALHEALLKLAQTHETSTSYPHVRLATIRAFELVFHALSGYIAERVGMEYEFEQPEYSAGKIFEEAYKKHLISQEDYIGCMELVAIYSMTGQVFDGDIAQELSHEVDELFPVICTVAQYTPEDLRS